MTDERIELFRSGTHTDSAGNTRNWAPDDVREIASIYNNQYPTHEAPAVLGHPADNDPAYGWVERLDTEDGVDERGTPITKLFGTFKDFVPEFIDMVKRGLYKKRSIALYADKLLRHVGWLGAVPPAIKGLANPQFRAADAITIEFSDSTQSTNTTMDPETQTALDAINKRMDAQDETLKQLLELAKADEAEDKAEDEADKQEDTGDDAIGQPVGNAGLPKQPAFNEAADKRISAVERENAGLKQQIQEAQFAEFLNSDEVKKRVIGKEQRQAVLETMRIMAKVGEHEFSDGKKESALERYKKQILAGPELVQFEEIATREAAAQKEKEQKTGYKLDDKSTFDPERREKLLEARELAKTENISFGEAAQRIMSAED